MLDTRHRAAELLSQLLIGGRERHSCRLNLPMPVRLRGEIVVRPQELSSLHRHDTQWVSPAREMRERLPVQVLITATAPALREPVTVCGLTANQG